MGIPPLRWTHIVQFIRNTMARLSNHHTHGAGFFDQKLLQAFQKLGIGFINSGNIYNDIKELADKLPNTQWRRYQKRRQTRDYLEYGDPRGSWRHFQRVILCRAVETGPQRLLPFARPLTIYYTKLGMGGVIDQLLAVVG